MAHFELQIFDVDEDHPFKTIPYEIELHGEADVLRWYEAALDRAVELGRPHIGDPLGIYGLVYEYVLGTMEYVDGVDWEEKAPQF